MNFKNAIKSGFKNYANFKGRAQRSEYWFRILFYLLVVVAGLVLESLVRGISLPIALIHLGLIIPTISVFVRRLHDTDRKGWWWLVTLIPFGGLVLFVWMCSKGTTDSNRFGQELLKPE